MRALVLCTLTAGLLLAGSTRSFAQEPKDIIEKAVKAHGGREKIEKYKALQTKSKGRLEIMGGLDMTQEASFQFPNKIKETMHLSVNGQQIDVTTVYNGKEGWIKTPAGTMKMSPAIEEAIKDALESLGMARLAFAGNKDYDLSPLGESKVNGRAGQSASRYPRKGTRN